MTDLTLAPDRVYPCVEIALTENGMVRLLARMSDTPGDYTLVVVENQEPGLSTAIERMSANLPPIRDEEAFDYVEAGQPRVLCDPLFDCAQCGREIQTWEYEHGDARDIEGGKPGVGLLCSESCAEKFYADYNPNEPDDGCSV